MLQPNVFGLQVANQMLPMIPAMGLMNGGQWAMMQLAVTQQTCGFPVQQLTVADPQLKNGLNSLIFGI